MADYAWSVQTLQALEEIGLTKVPRLAKKTWAEMASESDDDSETDLQKQIQKAKQTKTVCNLKAKQTMVQQDPTPKPSNALLFLKSSSQLTTYRHKDFYPKKYHSA